MDKSSRQGPPDVQRQSSLQESDHLSFIDQSEMISLDQFTVNQIMESLYEEFHDPLPSPNYASCLPFESSRSSDFNSASCSFADVSFGRPIVAVTGGDVSAELPQASSSFLSFDNQDSLHDPPQLCVNSAKGVVEPTNVIRSLIPRGSTWRENTRDFQRPERISMGSRPPSCAQDHVIAERKRRDRLKQQFLELSTIIPGLKKTDKVSLLGDAINYIRQLEEKVKTLEEKASEKTVASTNLVEKSEHLRACHHISSSEANPSSRAFPKVTASLDGNSSILVRIQCEKRKGLFVKVLSEIEKHHLSVVNTSAMPFAASSLNIAVTAQIEEGFSTTVKDLVKDIDSVLSQFI
uniref:BHLH domain-containing protein n=1 Tax=Musa acuminata subsp. malaccensis TaxID=214687 RepID=A0A804IKI8_MUSAM|nr:PREDICTED: transcription factor bHLH18-like [Musa acuminata subsp. malaccensis]